MTDHTEPSLHLRVTADLPVPIDPDMWPDDNTVPVIDQARDLYVDDHGDLTGDGFEALLMAAELGDGQWTARIDDSRDVASAAAKAVMQALSEVGLIADSRDIPRAEQLVGAVLDSLPHVGRYEVHDDDVSVWACMADTPQVADRDECEVQGCRGPHHLLAATRKV